MLATALDLVKDKYTDCPDCGASTEVEPESLFGTWFAVISCPNCGYLVEIELNPRNEAAIRY